MDLTLVYVFVVVIMAVCTWGIVFNADPKLRRVCLVLMLSVIAVGVYMERIKAQHDLNKANQQIIELAKCQSEQRLCAWSTK